MTPVLFYLKRKDCLVPCTKAFCVLAAQGQVQRFWGPMPHVEELVETT